MLLLDHLDHLAETSHHPPPPITTFLMLSRATDDTVNLSQRYQTAPLLEIAAFSTDGMTTYLSNASLPQ